MAELTFIEKEHLENFLKMKGGYVLDFSDRTFQGFVGAAINIDINEEKYITVSSSKANRLRELFRIEESYIVGKLIKAFLDYWIAKVNTQQINPDSKESLYKECCAIAEKLLSLNAVENLDAIKASSDDRDFKLIAKSIKESIEKDEPEAALDRLHTFVVKFIRHLCDKHGITYDKEQALNSIYGKYIKHLSDSKLFDSVMAERILKYSIHVLEAFNDIRNNKSFAHDNPILNYDESILIFNNVSNSIKFIQTIEDKNDKTAKAEIAKSEEDWDLPF